MTECTPRTLEFQPLGRRDVTARFDTPAITSDAGGLLLREVDAKFKFIEQFANCFDDHRSPHFTVHSLQELLAQRIFGIALGYEDLNDHEQLRHDPLMAVLAGKSDPAPQEGFALAGKSTLNRLELTPVGADQNSRYKKIVARHRDIEKFFVDAFLQVHSKPPKRIVLDLDATDDPLHGHQLGRFFHGYYKSYCYLPLYIFCGSHLLCAKLRPADIDASAGSVRQLERIIGQIRARWPKVQIVIRGDMENRIKEQPLYLFADRTSASTMRANQLRLWLSSVAYVLVNTLREFGLKGTPLEKAQCHTIRLKLFKVGAAIRVTVRKVWLSLSAAYPYAETFLRVLENLRALPLPRPSPG